LECETRLLTEVNKTKNCVKIVGSPIKSSSILELSDVLGFVNQSVKDIVAKIYHQQKAAMMHNNLDFKPSAPARG
jgi:hypothetical protein